MSDGFLATVLTVALAVFLAQIIAGKLFQLTPTEEVKKEITTGDPVKDFLINF